MNVFPFLFKNPVCGLNPEPVYRSYTSAELVKKNKYNPEKQIKRRKKKDQKKIFFKGLQFAPCASHRLKKDEVFGKNNTSVVMSLVFRDPRYEVNVMLGVRK